jgi:hypothetical protein
MTKAKKCYSDRQVSFRDFATRPTTPLVTRLRPLCDLMCTWQSESLRCSREYRRVSALLMQAVAVAEGLDHRSAAQSVVQALRDKCEDPDRRRRKRRRRRSPP